MLARHTDEHRLRPSAKPANGPSATFCPLYRLEKRLCKSVVNSKSIFTVKKTKSFAHSVSIEEFLDFLDEFGIADVDYPPEDLDEELEILQSKSSFPIFANPIRTVESVTTITF